jgi:hypothetical protein
MNIQSISIVVPTKGCINKCKFCVSRMHENNYDTQFDEIAYRKRIKFAANNGVNTLILTGTGEALQNIPFLRNLLRVLDKEGHPFPNVELQTSGVMLMDSKDVIDELAGKQGKHYYNMQLLSELGVNTISLSVSDITDSENNWNIIGAPRKYRTSLKELCDFIKKMGFNLRLSLNMTNVYDTKSPEGILKGCKYLGADQITFRKLYHSDDDSEQTKWVKSNACKESKLKEIKEYIVGETWHNRASGAEWLKNGYGTPLYRLPFGPMAYSIMGMSTVIDDNCMNKESYDQLKYVILRENAKLYAQWDDEGSLIF